MKYQPPYGITDPDGPYINGDPSIARQGSILPAAAAEYPQREIVNFIGDSDQIPTDDSLRQLTYGVRNQWVNFCIDTGSVNNLSVALTPTLTAYKQGVPLRVLVANNNTGPTVINVNSLGNRAVVRASGAQLEANDIRAGQIALLVDDGTRFQVMNFLGAVGGITNNFTIDIPYAEDTSTTPNSILANFGSQYGAAPAAAGDVVLVKLNTTNTSAVTITINALAPQPVRRNDGLPLQSQDLLKSECILIEYNTTYWQMLRLVKSQIFFKLTVDLTLYVRPDGNDTTGDGSVNDAAHAFRTVQRAIDYTKGSFLIAGRTVTIQLGVPGTYVGNIGVGNLPGAIVIRGDPSNALNYVLQGNAAQAAPVLAIAYSGTDVTCVGVAFSAVHSTQHNVECDYMATLKLQDVHFTGTSCYACIACTQGQVILSNYNHFWSSAKYALNTQQTGGITAAQWFTLFTMHNNYFSEAFCYADMISIIRISYGYASFAGAATGVRYQSINNSVILTGGGPTYLPGNIGGVTYNNGLYV